MKVESKQLKWPVIFVFLASVLTTLIFWAILPASFRIVEDDDYINFYEPVAQNILAGRGLIGRDGAVALRYLPGYPIILAGILGLSGLLNLPEGILLSIFTLICMGLASIFVFLLTRSAWGSLPALVSSLFWITCPFVLWFTKQPNSEIPFLVFFYGSFCLFWYGLRRKSQAWYIYFLSGLLIGFAMLIRPIAIGIGLVMGVILWLLKPEMKVKIRLFLVVIILLGNLAAVLPWEIWVYSKTNRVVALSPAGHISTKDGLTFYRLKTFRKGVRVPQNVEALMRDIYADYDKLNSFGDLSLFLLRELGRRPLVVAKLFAIKTARSWYGTDSNRFETPILFIQLFYLVLIGCSSVAAWKRGGITRQLAVSIWLVLLYFWGMTTAGLSIVRYMVPAEGLFFILVPGLFLNRTRSPSTITEDAKV